VVFAGVVVLAVLGSLSSLMLGAPRVYYAMARDGLFLPGVAAVHPRFGTPARAILLQAGLACVLAASGTFEQILGYFFFAVVAFVALTVAAVYVLRRRPATSLAYRTPGYPVTPLLFLVPIVFLLVLLALGNPVRSLLGVGVVALGVPMYHLGFRRGQPRSALRAVACPHCSAVLHLPVLEEAPGRPDNKGGLVVECAACGRAYRG
jgi:APA family basic amino acid/polyamine antiporter